jgi:hypothetical protein
MQVTTRKSEVDQTTLNRILDQWPNGPKETVQKMTQKYGLPNEATPSRVIWLNNGPWKETMVYREETQHDFPKPHKDHIKQFIDYKVPIGKFDQLAEFDGSVIVDRTKGETAARCDKEEMNFLALNLANDIVNNKTNAQQARKEYGQQAMALMKQEIQSAPYTQALKFNVPRGGTADPDKSTIGM